MNTIAAPREGASELGRRMLNKVPEVTLYFWVIKILCTTVGETAADYLNDGPEKPVRIWNRTGRRPLLAAGNSNGDVQMLEFTHHPDRPTLRLLVRHDDAEREFDYAAGAEHALERADTDGWTVISVKDDWTTVF
jgi:hypothetical protein